MENQWSFSSNPFIAATDSSFRKSVKISQLHASALNAFASDPAIAAMKALFDPLNATLNTAYDTYVAQSGTKESETMSVNENLRLLSNPKIRQWDVKIQNVFGEDTPEYKALLPNGRKPFQTGAQLMRINATNILSLAIGSDVALADLKEEVDLFYSQTNDAYNVQQGAISTSKGLSDAIDQTRINMCVGMYSNLGKLMAKYAATPGEIDKFFPLELIRNAQQVDFTNSVQKQSIRFIVKRTLVGTDTIRFVNDGTTDLWFYLAPNKTSTPDTQHVVVHQNSETTVTAASLGDVANTYIMAWNPETEQAGHFVMELL